MSEDDVISLDDLFEAREHYSYSQLNMYMRCSLQYMFRYVLGYKIPPVSALVFGSTTHEAIEANFKQKIESRKDLAIKKVEEIWAHQWEENLKKNDGMEFDEGENKNNMLDDGVKLISGFQEVISPTIQPVAVETAFPDLIIPGVSKKIIGKIDLIDEKDCIIDWKTRKRASPQVSIDKDYQLTMYSIGYFENYHKLPAGLIMGELIKTKKPQYLLFNTTRTQENMDVFKETICSVVRSIESGIFYPNPQNYLCGEKYCGYFKFCQFGKVKVNR